MSDDSSEITFCKSSKKFIRLSLIVLLAIIVISNISYLFSTSDVSYITYVAKDIFDGLGLLVFLILYDLFEADCIKYDSNKFTINKSGMFRSRNETYNYSDIEKINYMPYIKLLTIKMKQEHTYADISTNIYSFSEFEKFLEILESHKEITKGFYIPMEGIDSKAKFFGLVLMLSVSLSFLSFAIYLRVTG